MKIAQTLFLLSLTIVNVVLFIAYDSQKCHSLGKSMDLLKSELPDRFLYCMILTTQERLKTRMTTITSTWATKACSKYRFVLKLSDVVKRRLTNATNSKDLTSESFNLLEPKGLENEDYELLNEKVFRMFRDVYLETKDAPFKWYLKIDDDTYVHSENMIRFLTSMDHKKRLTLGYNNHVKKAGYLAGGPGYVMSEAAFSLIGEKLANNISYCSRTVAEDIDVSKCFQSLGIKSERSVDHNHKALFLPYNFFDEHDQRMEKTFSYCCSSSFVSVHYMSPEQMIHLDSVLNRLGRSTAITFKEIADSYQSVKKITENL